MIIKAGLLPSTHTGTAADRKKLADQFHIHIGSPHIGKGTEIDGFIIHHGTGAEHPGIGFMGNADHRIGFTILQADIITGLPLLDQIILKDQGFVFTLGMNGFYLFHPGHQKGGLPLFFSGEIGINPVFQILGLPHIDNLLPLVFHDIDTGGRGKFSNFGPKGFDMGTHILKILLQGLCNQELKGLANLREKNVYDPALPTDNGKRIVYE